MTPDEKLLRKTIRKKEQELSLLKEDLRAIVDRNNRVARERELVTGRKQSVLGVDLSLLQDDGK